MNFLALLILGSMLGAEAGGAPSVWQADPPGKLTRRLKSLTGAPGEAPIEDFGDPSPPDLSEKGKLRVYTTGGNALLWESTKGESALSKFLRAAKPKVERLGLFHSDGITAIDPENAGEDAWDPGIFVAQSGERILFAGVMRPTASRRNAFWPDDHWNRRVHAFRWQAGRWIMGESSVFGVVPEEPSWIGHNYGHSVFHWHGRDYFFYERVSAEKNGQPWLTEMFFQELIGPFRLNGRETRILSSRNRRWPAIQRRSGGKLMEGPRAFSAHGKIFVAFSAGEYASDNYGIHLLWSNSIDGKFTPFLDETGRDLRDFGREVERDLPLTWGAGRPAFFEAEGRWWVLFHGIEAGREDLRRNVFLAPVEFTRGKNGVPEPRIFP